MQTRCDEQSGLVVCHIEGELDAFTVSGFRETAAGLCGNPRVVLDLSGLTFLDSCGLGAMIGAIRRIRETGGQVALCSPGAAITRLLRTAGLDRIVALSPDLADAVGRLPHPAAA